MIKKILTQFILSIFILIINIINMCFFNNIVNVFGIRGTLVFAFIWLMPPLITIVLSFKVLEFLKIKDIERTTLISFLLNIVYACTYTYIARLRPLPRPIKGGVYLDIRGAEGIFLGISFLIGSVYCLYSLSRQKKKSI